MKSILYAATRLQCMLLRGGTGAKYLYPFTTKAQRLCILCAFVVRKPLCYFRRAVLEQRTLRGPVRSHKIILLLLLNLISRDSRCRYACLLIQCLARGRNGQFTQCVPELIGSGNPDVIMSMLVRAKSCGKDRPLVAQPLRRRWRRVPSGKNGQDRHCDCDYVYLTTVATRGGMVLPVIARVRAANKALHSALRACLVQLRPELTNCGAINRVEVGGAHNTNVWHLLYQRDKHIIL